MRYWRLLVVRKHLTISKGIINEFIKTAASKEAAVLFYGYVDLDLVRSGRSGIVQVNVMLVKLI